MDHDLVFSTRFIPSPVTRLEIHSPQMEQLDRHICCYNESPYLSKISIGSVFSRFSRVIFPGSIDGVALRWQLYKFVCTEIESVQFNSNHKATMSFASALLQLVFELICVGFFNEPEFEFFETKKIHFRKSEQYQPLTNLHNLEAVIASRLLAAKERDGTDDAIVSFNYLLAQNSGDDIDSDREDDRISESSSRYQFSTTSKKKSKSETSNGVGQYMKGTLVPAPKKKGKKFRQNLDQLSNIFDHFNEKMTSTRYVDVITKAITLLNKLEHMRNMLQIQTLWNSLSNVIGVSANKIKDNSYFQNLDRNLSEHVVEQIFSTKSDLNVANAVLSGIIHHNKVLTKACIDLIDYQLSMSANALATLPKVCFVDDADVVLQRYAKSFFLNVMKYYKEVFSSPMPTLHNVLLRIQFTLGSLRKLCFDSLSNKISGRDSQLDPHDKKLFKKSFVGFAVSTKATDFTVGRRAASDVPQRSYLTDYTIPCTPGSDSEYYFLDLENLMQDSSKKENLIDYFGSQRQAISEAYHRECQLNVESLLTVVFDDFVHCLVKQCRRPVERVRSATRKSQNDSLAVGNTEDAEETAHNRAAEVGIEIVDPFRSWQELYVSERHVVDSICTFLAEFLHTYNQLADKWLLQIKDLLLQYYPYSVGIVSLADAIIRYCNSDTLVYEKAFLESLLFNRIGSWLNNGDCTAIVPYRLLTYLLHKHGKIVATTSKFITSNLRKIMKSSFFTGKVFESQNDVSYYYLEFISALFRLQKVPVAISKEINRFAENRELILTILSNRETPLALKISLLPVVRSFQSRSSQQLEYVTAIVLEDIKRIRMFLAITSGSCEAPDISEKFRRINTMKNDDDGNLAASTYCYQYLVRGAMKHCKVCIKSTFIENETLINDHIILEARSCCSASYNNQTTDEVVSSLRKTFPTSTNSIHVDKGTIASSVIDCMLMILNILKMNDMKMLEAFSSADMDSLLWLLSACDIACREGCVTNSYVQVSVEHKNEDFNRDALKTFVSENAESNLNFVDFDNFTVVRVIMEKNFQGFMRDRVLKLARSSLLEKSTKVLLDKSIEFIEKAPELLKDKNDEHNLLLPDEFALYNSEFLRSTSVFKILEKTMKSALKFLEFGGKLILEDISSPAIKSESFASKFSTFTNYQLWLLGGGKLFKNIFEYLKFLKSPTQGDYNLLQIVIQLLHNTIDEIRASVLLPKKVKLKSVNKQIENIRKIQNALVSFGAVDFIIRTMESPRNDDYSWVFTRFALELSSELVAHRNANLQNLLVTKMLDDIRSKSSNFPNVAKGLKSLIRLCLTEVSSEKFSMSPTYGDQNQLAIPSTAGGGESVETETDSITARDKNKIKVSLLIKAIFEFMGSLCEGSNQRSKEFFSGLLDRKSVHNINEVSILTDTALDVFTRQLHYIDSEVFYDKLAPYIWLDKNSDKRRFISWTNPYSNIFEYTRWLLLSITMFENLSKVCISGLHLPLIRAIDKVPLVLEYLGLLNMSIEASVDEALGAGLSITRGITWEGGDPFKFAGKYAKELASLQLLEQEKDYTYIESCLFHWNTVLQESKRKDKASNENTKSTALSTIDKAIVVKNSKRMGSAYSSTYFVRLFGIQKKKMLEIARHCEHKALEAVLAVIDACEVSETAEVCSKFNDAILLQNMKSTFDEIISWSSGLANVDKQTGINVYYISLINTMGTSYSETTKELLGNWEDTMTKNGYNPKLLYGTVELLDDNQRVVRHFYPIPSFVKRYWLYPETQLTKEKVVVEVNRNSPEEKIADFLDQMERLVRVMKRQERLRLLLTPPIHAIFGGKTLPLSWLFPRIRISLLVLTFIIVIYITYDQSLPSDFDASGGNYLKYYYDWYFRDNFERIVKSGHFIITCTVAIRSLLNCEASDEIPSLIETDSNIINMLGKVVTIPYWLFLMINECLWSIILVGLSYLGLFVSIWFYVPCLLDIVFLFKDMYFLYVAIVRNLSKIVFTLLLAFLCLYFFAVMAFLFFPDQYEFDGHSDCNSLTACFKLHLDYGLINAPDWEGGYISPAINGLNGAFVYGTVIARLLGTVYNLSFIILINLVLQAIISGLIIDTFSEMRAENETIQQDIKDKCFICSIGTEVFEQVRKRETLHVIHPIYSSIILCLCSEILHVIYPFLCLEWNFCA